MKHLSFIACSFLLLSACKSNQPLETVEYVDLEKYQGIWYDVASFPQRFQKGCYCTSATYTQKDKYIEVYNRCAKDSADGKISSVKGKAFVRDEESNAKLAVQFFWPFKGKYWVIGLDEDYRYAVIGEPSRRYLWILSRTRQLPEELYNEALAIAASKGFDISKLEKVTQSNCVE